MLDILAVWNSIANPFPCGWLLFNVCVGGTDRKDAFAARDTFGAGLVTVMQVDT
jgi:hypothetical protein